MLLFAATITTLPVHMIEHLSRLSIPHVESEPFSVNFLKTVVCELKFPVILEWETTPPAKVQKATPMPPMSESEG